MIDKFVIQVMGECVRGDVWFPSAANAWTEVRPSVERVVVDDFGRERFCELCNVGFLSTCEA